MIFLLILLIFIYLCLQWYKHIKKYMKPYINFLPHDISWLLREYLKRKDIEMIYRFDCDFDDHGWYIYLGKFNTNIKFSIEVFNDLKNLLGEEKAIQETIVHYGEEIKNYLDKKD